MRNHKAAPWLAVVTLSLLQAVPRPTQASSCFDPREELDLKVLSVTVDDVAQRDLARWDRPTSLLADYDGVRLVIDGVETVYVAVTP